MNQTDETGLSVIVPTWNEAANLLVLLPRIAAALSTLGCPCEVLVVDDDSPDGSARVAAELAAEFTATQHIPTRVLVRCGARGLASAVVDGARNARYPVVAVLDADLSHDPAALFEITAPVLDGRFDVVIGSRYVAAGSIGRWPRLRRLTSGLGTRLARALTAVRDPLSGFFAARRDLVDASSLPLAPRGYKILLEILARSRGRLRVGEVPIRFEDRRAGASKFGARQAGEFLLQLSALACSRIRPHRTTARRVASARRLSTDLPESQEACR